MSVSKPTLWSAWRIAEEGLTRGRYGLGAPPPELSSSGCDVGKKGGIMMGLPIGP